MYARLVMATAPSNYNDFCRDLARLVTSGSPSTSLLSSSTWNTTASSIVDATPAGWTFVGSTLDADTLAAVNTGGTAPAYNNSPKHWVVRSACLAPNTGLYKYVGFSSQQHRYIDGSFQLPYTACITLCQSSTTGGVLTNEAARVYTDNINNANWGSGWGFRGTGTYHLIANARHITLIKENSNIQAVWEHSNTDLHTRYGQAPAVFYNWGSTGIASAPSWVAGTGSISGITVGGASDGAWLCNITDVTSGTTYGGVNVSGAASTIHSSGVAQPYLWPNLTKVSTISSTGATRQLVSPIMFQYYNYGYPTMYVTGTSPVYMCKGNIGAAGDNISVAGSDYIYVPVNAAIGLAIKSS